nr:hypothetical protein [Desulfobacterales bacterium]
MSDSKIVIYHYANREIRSFLIHTEISGYRVEHFRGPVDRGSEDALKRLGVIGAQVVKGIMSIQGVMEIWIKPKEIRIRKEKTSSWDEIEKRIVKVLNEALRRKEIRALKV